MRAERFPLELPVRYRRVGEAAWLQGTTQNISYSGVLFHADEPLDVDTLVEISITLAVAAPSQVLCQARIVRAEARPSGPPAALSAAFLEYQLFPC
jgi:hypothetical protein